MNNSNFKPIYCTACGKLIWEGLTVGFQIKLDPATLTIQEEIIKRINKLAREQPSYTGQR